MIKCQWGHDDCDEAAVEGILVSHGCAPLVGISMPQEKVFCPMHSLIVRKVLETLNVSFYRDLKLENPKTNLLKQGNNLLRR